MRKLILGFVIALGLVFTPAKPAHAADCTWAAVSGASRSVVGSGAVNCTLTVATATTSFGLNLSSVATISVKVCAATGQTISTLFELDAYTMDPWSNQWARDTQYDLSEGATGTICQVVGSWNVTGAIGRVAFIPSAGAVSSGSITIRIIASRVGGGRI